MNWRTPSRRGHWCSSGGRAPWTDEHHLDARAGEPRTNMAFLDCRRPNGLLNTALTVLSIRRYGADHDGGVDDRRVEFAVDGFRAGSAGGAFACAGGQDVGWVADREAAS
jgi:hypothetical protein